jgi:hypothetical protein
MLNFSLRAFVALFVFLSVSSVSAQTKVVVIPLGGDDAPAPTVYAIGDTGPAGGIVFDVTNGGLNGLEAALVDQGTAPWNCIVTNITSVVDLVAPEDLDPNSGAVNTPLIAVQCPGTATNAAVLAAVYVWPNGQTDGFFTKQTGAEIIV